jgi:hypothetical protein
MNNCRYIVQKAEDSELGALIYLNNKCMMVN